MLWCEQDGKCAICGRGPMILDNPDPNRVPPDYATFDHKVPLSKGGRGGASNVQLAHKVCNAKRGNRPL